MSTVLRLAVQRSGRLSEDTEKLLKESGIRFQSTRGSNRLLTRAEDFPLELLFLRDDDIPGYVADGVADLGVVGQNVVVESGATVDVREYLGFSHCRLSLAVPRGTSYHSAADLQGQRIATSYPRLLGEFLKEQGVTAEIHTISGSAEIAPGIGLADAVCDLVSSGSTLATNGLAEVETVFRSEAVLIATPKLSAEKQQLMDRFQFRLQAVGRARKMKYVLFNAPNDNIDRISALLPGSRSPSVMPLALTGWSALHVAISENDFWNVVEELRSLGAEGILVLPVEKMV